MAEDNTRPYPHFKTVQPNTPGVMSDLELHVTLAEGAEPIRCCGESWCSGKCGLPACVLTINERELKGYSNMVAMGHVFAGWRVEWTGAKMQIPTELATNELLERMWH